MSDLRAIGRAQTQQLGEFRASDAAHVLTRLSQTECLLELAKLSSARVDLASYAGTVVGIITQFIPSRACAVDLQVSEVPPISVTYGNADAREIARNRHQLVLSEEPVGALTIVAEVHDPQQDEFVELLVDQVASSLGTIVEAERLRRQAAVAQTIHLVQILSDQPNADDLHELVKALASLPNALGARLDVAHTALGGALSLTAGSPTTELPASLPVSGGSVGIAIRWAETARERDRENLAQIVNMLALSFNKAEERRRLRDEVETDPLTGIGNRRRAIRALASAIELAGESGESVGVVYLDLDFFKRVNDTLGHDVGDQVLVNFAQHLVRMVRTYDTVARLGGEEFLLVCPGLTEPAALALAERILTATPTACGEALPADWRQTASAGVASYPTSGTNSESLLHAADQALYVAKDAGRDKVRSLVRTAAQRV